MNLLDRDKEHRTLALDATRSFIVQAPAGSGKTELLIQRFLTLLIHVKAPEEILAITFTKKAANEMRYRVIKALKNALSETGPESPHAKQTWFLARQVLQRDSQLNWNIINNPNQLRIQTIDALCAYLTRQLPLLSHFGSQPGIADSPASLYREAVQEVLTHVEHDLEWSQSIAQLLLHLDNDLNKLHDLLVTLLAKRDQWLPYIHFDTSADQVRRQLERHLELVITDSLTAVKELFPKQMIQQWTSIARFAADNLVLLNQSSEITSCRHLTDLPGTEAGNKNMWVGLARLLLTKSFSWRKRVDEDIGFPALNKLKNPQEKNLHTEYRQQLNTLIAALQDHEALRLALTELFFLPDSRYQDSQWAILKALLHVLKIVAAQLRLTFQQHGQIDFIENAQAALLALGKEEYPTDLVLSLDYQIKHILVDEFQDTSFSQYQLLEKLTAGWETHDGRTLFVVGDPMQSIYRFRQAEVGIFIRMCKRGIGQVELTPLTLSVNFRSSADIVEWNNAHFKKIFPLSSDMATGAVTYSPSVSHQPDTAEELPSEIRLKGFANVGDDVQAHHIVAAIQEMKNANPEEKMAILVRSRGHLAAIIPVLKKANIPYCAIDIDPLASRQHIQDLLSLTCALLHPADRIAWLAVLRAPWCGLTLADLLVIAGKSPYTTLVEELEKEEITKLLSADGRQRLSRVFPVLKRKMVERERDDFRYWIESTWLLLGGPAYLDDDDMSDANAYFKLLDEFSQNNAIIHLDKLKEKINQLFASTQHDGATLQIMTIHTAKGLEFDTVILPHLQRKIPSDDKSLLSWMERPLPDDQVALLLAPMHATGSDKDPTYEYINRQQRIKSDYETDRLFYVAATRAKKRLYMFFNVTRNDKNEYRVETGSFLEKIWPYLQNNLDNIISCHEMDDKCDNAPENQSGLTSRLTTDWKNPVEEKRSTSVASHQQQSGFQLSDNKPKWIGIVSHRILQLISQSGTEWWQHQTPHDQQYHVKQQLSHLGVLSADLKAAAKLTLQIITQTLSDDRGRWILKQHTEARSEFALTALLDGNIENLVIDRTFIDENQIRWIIDYKTTTFSHHDLNHFLAHEQEKYLEKMRKYAEAMKLIDPRPIRLGLYFPAIPAWKEWE